MADSSKLFVREATGLSKALGTTDLILLSVAGANGVVSQIATMLYAPYFFPGANLPIDYALGALAALTVALVYGMLGRAMPRAGGDYVWSTRIMGPLFGTIQWALLFFTLVILIAQFVVILPISLFLPQLLFSLGVTLNNQALLNAVSTVSQPYVGLLINFVFLGCALSIALVSLRSFVRIQRYIWILVFAVLAVLVGTLLSLNTSSTSSVFDHAMQVAGSNATFSGVIQQGTTGGLTQGFNLNATLLAVLPWGFFAFVGFNWSTYLSGEIKNAKSMLTKALVMAVIVEAVIAIVPTVVAYYSIGQTFLNSASYVALTNPSYLPTLPTISVIASLTNPFVSIFIGVGIIVSEAVIVAALTLNASRMIFAASFDRILPKKFADVNDRFHTPQWAILLIGLFYAILIPLFWLTSWASVSLNTSLVTPVASALPFVTALVFYYRKPQLFAQTLGGRNNAVKLILLSLVALAMFGIYIFSETVPLSTGLYLGTSLQIAAEAVGFLVLVGIILYAIARFRAKSSDINFNKIYQEIPPE